MDGNHRCPVCNRPAKSRCAKCQAVWYCSSECQRKDWFLGHKSVCKKPTGNTPATIISTEKTLPRYFDLKASPITGPEAPSRWICDKSVIREVISQSSKYNPGVLSTGMKNKGGWNCFMNSVIQALFGSSIFRAYLLEKRHSKAMKHEPESEAHRNCLFCLLEDFCEAHTAANKEGKAISLSPDFIISRLMNINRDLIPGVQHDAQEFLLLLLQHLSEISGFGVKDPIASSATTDISQIFGGWVCRVTQCPQCSKASTKYERYLVHSLDIGEASSSVREALQASSVAENITLTCSFCGKSVRASSRMMLASVPPVFIVHLKRFRAGIQGKISQHIEFSDQLDLQDYIIPSQTRFEKSGYMYKLVSVVEHLDLYNIVSFGHYVAYVSGNSRDWYLANDGSVSKISKEDVLDSNGYILIYQRVETNSIGIPCGLPAPPKRAAENPDGKEAVIEKKSSCENVPTPESSQAEPSLCLGGCGFYGGKDTRGYCSCCFKKKFPEEARAMAEEKAKRDQEKRLSEPNPKPAAAQNYVPNAYKKPVIIQQKKKVAYKVGKNEKCPCGSGKKYKMCCYGKE